MLSGEKRLCTPTQITKIDGVYFIVDCWHHRIFYNDRLSADLNDWKIMPGETVGGHTIAGSNRMLIADSTDTDELVCYRKKQENDGFHFELCGRIDIRPFLPFDVGKLKFGIARPHCVLYDNEKDCFLVAVSGADTLLVVRDHEDGVSIDQVFTPKEFKQAYLKFVSKIDGAYWMAANDKLFRFQLDGDSLNILSSYKLPPHIRSDEVNAFTKIGGTNRYYMTICRPGEAYVLDSPQTAQDGILAVKPVGEQLRAKGIPYAFSEFDDQVLLTEIEPVSRIVRFRIKNNMLEPDGTLFDFGAMTGADRAIRAHSPLYRDAL